MIDFGYTLNLGLISVTEGHSGESLKKTSLLSDIPFLISIYSQILELKNVKHHNLCQYIHVSKPSAKLLLIVTEFYPISIDNVANFKADISPEWLKSSFNSCLSALSFLDENGLIHGNLTPDKVLVSPKGNVKIFKYGLFSLIKENDLNEVSDEYKIYHSPEKFLNFYRLKTGQSTYDLTIKTDLWSLAMIYALFKFKDQIRFPFDMFSLREILKHYLLSLKRSSNDSIFSLSDDADVFLRDVSRVLVINLKDRPDLEEIVAFFSTEISDPESYFGSKIELSDQCQNLNSYHTQYTNAIEFLDQNDDLEEVYHYWELSGGDVDQVYSKAVTENQNYLCNKMSVYKNTNILFLPNYLRQLTIKNEVEFSERFEYTLLNDRNTQDIHRIYSNFVIPLPADRLLQKINQFPFYRLYPCLLSSQTLVDWEAQSEGLSIKGRESDRIDANSNLYKLGLDIFDQGSDYLGNIDQLSRKEIDEIEKQPLKIRETNADYQIYRVRLFKKLLAGLPMTEVLLKLEARIDIPPFLRTKIWPVLLGQDSAKSLYTSYVIKLSKVADCIDEKSINQILVDLPRCHSYEPLLVCLYGQGKLKRILLSLLVGKYDSIEYTQGMDSLAAVFTKLYYHQEHMASYCLNQLISTRLYRIFSSSGFSDSVRSYFVVIRHLLAFHQPLLSNHLSKLGVPLMGLTTGWIYTLFSHSFTLDIVERLWDTILPGPVSLPYFIYIAIFIQMDQRFNILKMNLEDICMMVSGFPEMDLDQCVHDALLLARSTPVSLISHDGIADCPLIIPVDYEAKKYYERRLKNNWPLHLDEFEFKKLIQRVEIKSGEREKTAYCGVEDNFEDSDNRQVICYISIKDLIELYHNPETLVVDIRDWEDFKDGCLIQSFNLPYNQTLKEANSNFHVKNSNPSDCTELTERLIASPSWSRATEARRASEKGLNAESPGLLVILYKGFDPMEEQLASNLAATLNVQGIDRVCVASGGIKEIISQEWSYFHLIPYNKHPLMFGE